MADFVLQDDVQNRHRTQVARLFQLGLDRRCGVQATRLQGARHQGHTGSHVVSGGLGHAPQAVVGVEIAVVMAQRLQVLAQQREVQGLFARHLQPVAVELFGQAVKAPDRIQRQIDRIELDVADRMQQRGAASQREGRPARHLVGRHQPGQGGAAGQRRGGHDPAVGIQHTVAGVHGRQQCAGLLGLAGRIREGKYLQGAVSELHP